MSLDGMEAVCVKQECDSEGCGDNEAALAALYEDHVVKQELVLGPELLQKPSVVYTPPASVSTSLEAACVKPEQEWDSDDGHSETEDHELNEELVDEDPELGPVVLKEELELGPVVLQRPDALYTLRGQARLLAAKKTKLAKRNKPEALVKEKKMIPSEKIAKRNFAEMIQKSSDIQEVSPEKPAGSSSSSEVKHLNTHMLKTAGTSRKTSKFTCKTCNCIFDTKLLLHEHEKSRHGGKYSACDECEYASNQSAHLKTHTGKKRFKCSWCRSAFSYSSLLQRHLRTHTGEKPFKCSQCSSAFTQRFNLQDHLRTHTGEKPFKCNTCDSAFSNSNILRQHLITHTGEKPFQCSQCTSAFYHRSHLQSHLRIHTGEKPFKCSQCSSEFSHSSDLRVHLRTHTGEKPFECNICDYKSTLSNNLKSHLMSRHSGQKPFGCDACGYRGATKSYLRQHMKRKHHKST